MNVDVDMSSDAQRIQWVKFLLEQGYRDRLLIAQDIHTKHRLVGWGGGGGEGRGGGEREGGEEKREVSRGEEEKERGREGGKKR